MCPRVSVIIPTYNCKEYICEAVDSLLNQSFKDFELIIVNDGSTDGTEEVIEYYINRFPEKIEYIKQKNKGAAAARNAGIRASSGEFIAFLDADDLWLPNKLTAQISVFDTHPSIGLVHTNVYGFGGPSGTYLGRYWMTSEQIERHSGHIFLDFFFRNIRITFSTVMIRRTCLTNVGLLDEYLNKFGGEDRDLLLRVLWEYKAYFINHPLAKYRDRTDSRGQKYEKKIIGQTYIYDKITQHYNLPASYKKKAMSSIYVEWAEWCYSRFRILDGLKLQMKAIKCNPRNRTAYTITQQIVRNMLNT